MLVAVTVVGVLPIYLGGVATGAPIGSNRYGPKYDYEAIDGAQQHHYVTFNYGNMGAYKFSFKLPDQEREEERNEEGEVVKYV